MLGLIVLIAVVGHDTLLTMAASLLVASGVEAEANKIAILSGDRCFAIAAQRVRSGQADAVLIFEPEPRRLERAGVLPEWDAICGSELKRGGVPESSLETISGQWADDWDAARLLDAWLEQHPEAQVLVFCDRFESRRAEMILAGEIDELRRGRVSVEGLPDRRYDESNWWRSRTGLKVFFAASLHFAYAYLRGEDPQPTINWDPDAYVEAALR